MVVGAAVVVQHEPLDADEAVKLDPLGQIVRVVTVDRAGRQIRSSGFRGHHAPILMESRDVFSQRELEEVLGQADLIPICAGDGEFTVGGDHFVRAADSARVVVGDAVSVEAGGSATVVAGGRTHVTARNSATVEADDSATVIAGNHVFVQARGRSRVVAGRRLDAWRPRTIASIVAIGAGRRAGGRSVSCAGAAERAGATRGRSPGLGLGTGRSPRPPSARAVTAWGSASVFATDAANVEALETAVVTADWIRHRARVRVGHGESQGPRRRSRRRAGWRSCVTGAGRAVRSRCRRGRPPHDRGGMVRLLRGAGRATASRSSTRPWTRTTTPTTEVLPARAARPAPRTGTGRAGVRRRASLLSPADVRPCRPHGRDAVRRLPGPPGGHRLSPPAGVYPAKVKARGVCAPVYEVHEDGEAVAPSPAPVS